MSTILDQIRAQADAEALTGPDMNEAQVGGSGKVLPIGTAQARLVGYVEIGQQPQSHQGVAKGTALEYQLCFALTGAAPDPTDPAKTIPYTNEDGTPYLYWTYPRNMSRNDKAGAFLMFKAMNYKGHAKNFGQLIGESFLLPVIPYTAKQGKNAGKVTNIPDLKGIRPPYYADPVSGQMVTVNVAPPREQDLKYFSWANPTLEGFNSLKVEGEWENKDATTGVVTKESKNKQQEAMLGATDFIGSPLELLLKQNNVAYTIPAKKAAPAAAVPAAAPAVPVAAAPAVAPAAPVVVAPNLAPPAGVAVVTPQPAQPTVAASPAPVVVAAPAVAAPIQVVAPAVVSPAGVAPEVAAVPVMAPAVAVAAPVVTLPVQQAA